MNELSKREMRTVFCETLMNMAENDQKVIVLDADLMLAMGTIPFREKYPERTFDCGVQEANMIGVAAGLSATGFIPFAHTLLRLLAGVHATRYSCLARTQNKT